MKKFKKNVQNQEGFSDKYKEFWNFIVKSKIFLLAILGIFVISGLAGFFYPEIYAEELEKMIQELMNKTQDLNFTGMLAFIIQNNIKTSMIGLLLGLFFGIIPLAISSVNGYLLGFIFNKLYLNNESGEMWRILPHGIFELPAFFLSLGLGLRLGFVLFFKNKEFKQDFKTCLRIFIFVVIPLLILAGIIETGLIFLLR